MEILINIIKELIINFKSDLENMNENSDIKKSTNNFLDNLIDKINNLKMGIDEIDDNLAEIEYFIRKIDEII